MSGKSVRKKPWYENPPNSVYLTDDAFYHIYVYYCKTAIKKKGFKSVLGFGHTVFTEGGLEILSLRHDIRQFGYSDHFWTSLQVVILHFAFFFFFGTWMLFFYNETFAFRVPLILMIRLSHLLVAELIRSLVLAVRPKKMIIPLLKPSRNENGAVPLSHSLVKVTLKCIDGKTCLGIFLPQENAIEQEFIVWVHWKEWSINHL